MRGGVVGSGCSVRASGRQRKRIRSSGRGGAKGAIWVNSKTKTWISPDNTNHKGPAWKVFSSEKAAMRGTPRKYTINAQMTECIGP
ncbi:toxin C-terminal domain-containing protein [Nocardioides lacus]|uniref:toxin C-terminal domain-containing protein n=1 Tax=Nocardioides sp. BP30 TaxID=3036374 RepID=UPI00406C46EC